MGTHIVLKPWMRIVLVASVLALVVPMLAGTRGPVPAASAAADSPGSITLRVESARSVASGPGFVHQHDPITDYKWMINVDDTGDPGTSAHQGTESCLPPGATGGSADPGFADTCPWPSIRNTSGYTPIVAQGNQDDLGTSTALDNLPPGKYLISVTADGFKIDGEHFTVQPGSTQQVTVGMNPTPLPLTTIQIQVFQDQAPVDATYEADAERGLAGFGAHLTDVFGEVSTDYYGNALCTTYRHEGGNPNAPIVFDADNRPVVAASSTGRCVSGADGIIKIPNLGPNRYAAVVTPPRGHRNDWVQTTTLEGATDHDIWVQEGETGLDNEVLKGGEAVPMVVFGFARPRPMSVPATNPPTGGVKGTVVAGLPYIGGAPGLSYETGFPNTKVDGPISRPWVALSDLGAGDAAVYVGRGDANGAFDIKHVPNGTYQLSVWDNNLDYILWSFNVTVRGGRVSDVGNKMIVGWFTHVHGHVFVDSNENGKRDPGEKSVPGFTLTVRERDNSLMDQYTNTKSTDDQGAYDIRETYPLGKWLVLEAFNTRYRTTGISYRGENEKKWTTKLGGLVDVNFLPIIGLGGEIDWGVKPYQGQQNGGIAGTVSYDTTRNELDPADAASESYQPGIPDVKVHLYASTPCAATTPGEKLNTCRQGKAVEPLQVNDASGSPLLATPTASLVDGDGDGVADAGETVDYTVTLRNTGTSELTDVTVTGMGEDQVQCPTDPLAAGGTVDCTATHVVTQAEVDQGLVRREVTGHGQDAGTGVDSAPADVETAADAASGLALVERAALNDTDNDGRADAGETVDYTVTATNTGDRALSGLSVTSKRVARVTCPDGPLPAGAQVECTGSYAVALDDVLRPTLADTAGAGATLPDGTAVTAADSTDTLPTDLMRTNPSTDRGALVRGPEISDAYTSETWQPPRGCTAYDYKGNVLSDQRALPEFGESADRMCVEAPMMGVAVGPSDKTPGDAGQTVNGNYGFSTSTVNLFKPGDARNPAPDHQMPLYAPLPAGQEQDLVPGDYIVSVDIPDNPVGGGKMYKATSEEDVNVFDGDSYLPQENIAAITPGEADNPPPGDQPTAVQPSQPPSQQAGIISACAGALHTVKVTNPTFVDGGGSPFEGQDRPSCESKLVTVRSGQTAAPNFNLFTDVPLPTHFWGVTLNDLGLTFDKRSVNYGEAQGLPFVPVGLYDYAGRLVDTVHTDFNGLYEALEPSTDTFNCPVPAGPCPNMYRFVGNDPGQPGALNSDYNPRFRTIAANFQGWPGLYTVTDEAPTQVASIALAPDGTTANPTQCDLDGSFPQLFAIDRPVVRMNVTGSPRTIRIRGTGFGSTPGQVRLGNAVVPTSSWSDDTIDLTVPSGTPLSTQALSVTTAAGVRSVNGVTVQVVDGRANVPNSAANPQVVEVGPGAGQHPTIQDGIEAARQRYAVVVVWPGAQTQGNPRGEYTENLIVHSSLHLQGVGPGGFLPSGAFVPGSIVDGVGFNPDNQQGTDWINLLSSLSYTGDPAVPVGAVVTVLHDPRSPNLNGWSPAIDGFTLTGGVQLDYPTNINTTTGGASSPYGGTGALTTQGGGVYVHDSVSGLQVADNVITGNSGSYGGGVRVGTPYLNSRNSNVAITRNQVRDNGGSNLAGGIGIFQGSNGYQVTDNAICGNFSAEYGGALTAFGYQGNTTSSTANVVSGNRIWFNGSYDEGGAVMIAGELPARPTQLSPGTGPATIDRNVISTNVSNDDGGGIRLLMTSGSTTTRATPGRIRITNNTIADNVSAHEGGGIALDDAAFVDVVGNTIAKNLTTATAVTSDGRAAPAGLSTATNSDPLQARLRSTFLFPGSQTLAGTTFSKPTLFDNVFWDNRAGSYNGGRITGLGTMPDGTDGGIVNWDLGMVDVPVGRLTPSSSVLQTDRGTDTDPTVTLTNDPALKDPFDLQVDVLSSRTYPAFRLAWITAAVLPPTLTGDYHLTGTGSPAYGRGVASKTVTWGTGTNPFQYTVTAPANDRDAQARPTGSRWDAGSDQYLP